MNIILIHLGDKKIHHLNYCIKQILIFNKDINIYLLSKPKCFNNLKRNIKNRIIYINYTKLNLTKKHIRFKKFNKITNDEHKNFWIYTSERFLYLENIVKKFNLKDIFHIENDCMIYFSIKKKINLFRKNYNIAIIPESNKNSIPVLLYFKNHKSLETLSDFFSKINLSYLKEIFFFKKFFKFKNDMQTLHKFLLMNYKKKKISNLPTISNQIDITEEKKLFNFSNNYKKFKGIFDPSYLGIQHDGLDRTFKGFKKVDKSTFIKPPFNLKDFKIKFLKEKKFKLPFLINKNIKIRIFNIHIHSKNLKKFIS